MAKPSRLVYDVHLCAPPGAVRPARRRQPRLHPRRFQPAGSAPDPWWRRCAFPPPAPESGSAGWRAASRESASDAPPSPGPKI
eukprot:1176117-Prorocentrum_minimum.AAC.2